MKDEVRDALLCNAMIWRRTVLHSIDGKPTLGDVMDACRDECRGILESVEQYFELTGCPEMCPDCSKDEPCIYLSAIEWREKWIRRKTPDEGEPEPDIDW